MSERKLTPWVERLLYTSSSSTNIRRYRMQAIANNLILHLHPTTVPAPALRFSYTWGLGGISSLLAVVLIITGVLLMFRYDASVERAYTSIQFLETQVAFGSLLRALHHWSGNLLLITVFLHLVRVFYTGGFKAGRSINWLIGLVLLLMVVTFNFTGYLLPWDQLAYWAITVGTSLLGYIPLIGSGLSNFLLAGPEVGQSALRNFYAIHVAVLPALLILVMSYHFWRVRKDGGISQSLPQTGERVEKLTTIPHLVQIEFAAATVLLAALALGSMLAPAPLEALANPAHPPNPAKAAWYFMGLQELLLHMHPLAALILPGIVLLALAALPYWDTREDDIAIYFRSPAGRWAAIISAALSLVLAPLLVVLDEWWLDLPTLLSIWPTWFSNGLVPLLLTFGGLAAIYYGLQRGLKANRSEALVGLFTFIMVSLVVLTIIGIFLRGPNMALVWPF
ncbi:MAG: cytochrome b N-terminal domain-containing protein [Chloroflexi bacterium]|nr:cytochrome b N-terminal domain-containing protein [Chloroflexota bacterium]